MEYFRYWHMAITPKDLFCDCYGNEYGNLSKKNISVAFKMMMKYIILDLINRGVGFKFPGSSNARFEFLVVNEDKVKSLKNRGWIDKLSVFDSDFLCYKLHYCKGKVKIPINFHSYLQDALFDKINTGANLCSVKYKTLKDYFPIFYRMYPNVPKKDIKRLIQIGFERLFQIISAGAAFSITSNKIKMHIGTISWNSYKRSNQFKKSFMVRERYKYIWNGEFYSGYYYIPVTSSYLKTFAELNVKSKYWVHFGKVHAYKVLNEVRWRHYFTYVFRVPMEEQKKFTLNIRDKTFKNPELIGIFEKGVFREDHTPWKKIIKQYNETGK